jgi:hypothetical protein
MEEVEVIFRDARTLIKQLTITAKELLEISHKVCSKDIKLSDIDLQLHGGKPSAHLQQFSNKKRELLHLLQQTIRHRLLYAPDDNFIHNFLFLLLKLYTEVKWLSPRPQILLKQNESIFDNFVSIKYKSGITTIPLITESLPFNDLGELVTLTGFYLIMAGDLIKQIIKVIRHEFSLKTDDIKGLFDQDKYGPIPVALHRFKKLLTQEPATVKPNQQNYLKIPWAGNLKQFAELITELEKKGWINPISPGELQATVTTLLHCFDLSATQRNEDSSTTNSLLQYMKPSERDLKIYTKRYIRKFTGISPNLSQK